MGNAVATGTAPDPGDKRPRIVATEQGDIGWFWIAAIFVVTVLSIPFIFVASCWRQLAVCFLCLFLFYVGSKIVHLKMDVDILKRDAVNRNAAHYEVNPMNGEQVFTWGPAQK